MTDRVSLQVFPGVALREMGSPMDAEVLFIRNFRAQDEDHRRLPLETAAAAPRTGPERQPQLEFQCKMV